MTEFVPSVTKKTTATWSAEKIPTPAGAPPSPSLMACFFWFQKRQETFLVSVRNA